MFKFGFELRKYVARSLPILSTAENRPSVHRTVLFNSKEAVDHSFSFKVGTSTPSTMSHRADTFKSLDRQLGMVSDCVIGKFETSDSP